MATSALSSSASRLLDHHRLRGRSYPTAKYWERLREQVVWADRYNLLHRVQEFFDRMPTSCWNRSDT